jgi:alpha-beta hydrolase superfamily lysophospholipase
LNLDLFAEKFAEAGYAVLAFDYRGFALSSGLPRCLIHPKKHLQDWENVIDFVRQSPNVSALEGLIDSSRIALWGSSFSGGHVVALSSICKGKIRAVVSQVPFVEPEPQGLPISDSDVKRNRLQIVIAAVRDLLRSQVGLSPLMIKVFRLRGETGLIVRDSPVVESFVAKKDKYWQNEVLARSLWNVLPYNPSSYVKDGHDLPILFFVTDGDDITPPKPVIELSKKLKNSKVVRKPGDHFVPYVPPLMLETSKEMIQFFGEHL